MRTMAEHHRRKGLCSALVIAAIFSACSSAETAELPSVELTHAQYADVAELASASEYLARVHVTADGTEQLAEDSPPLGVYSTTVESIEVISQRPDAVPLPAKERVELVQVLVSESSPDLIENDGDFEADRYPGGESALRADTTYLVLAVDRSDSSSAGRVIEVVGWALEDASSVTLGGFPGELAGVSMDTSIFESEVAAAFRENAPWRQQVPDIQPVPSISGSRPPTSAMSDTPEATLNSVDE